MARDRKGPEHCCRGLCAIICLRLQVGVDREAGAHGFYFGFHLGLNGCVAFFAVGGKAVDDFDDPVGDLAELGLAEPARGARRGAEADAGGYGRLFGVKRHAVFVAGDVRTAKGLVHDVACHAFGAQVHQYNVGVGAVGDEDEIFRRGLDAGADERAVLVGHGQAVLLEDGFYDEVEGHVGFAKNGPDLGLADLVGAGGVEIGA